MIVNDVEERMVHRLPFPKRRMDAEMGRGIRQPACTGAFPLYWIGTEEAVHLVLVSVRSHARMRSISVLASVPALLFVLLRHCVLMPTVLLLFLWRFFLFATGRGMMLMVVARRLLAGVLIGLFKFF